MKTIPSGAGGAPSNRMIVLPGGDAGDAAAPVSPFPSSVAAGDETWVQLAPWGTHRLWDEEKKKWVGQRLDEATGSQLVRAFSGDILVDADHSSENGGSTEALAWIMELDDRPDGLWALFRWTDKGAEAVSGRRYRFVSPAWTVDAAGRPDRLVSCALTNRPNIPSRPILNRAGIPQLPDSPIGQSGNRKIGQSNPDSAAGGSGEPTRKPEMEELKKLLGLAPDADDAAVLAAVQAIQAELAASKEAALNSEAEAFADENKDGFEDREALKNSYKADPELAKAIVKNMKAPAKPAETAKPAEVATAAGRVFANRAPVGPALMTKEQAREKLASLSGDEQRAFYRDNAALIDG